MSPPYNVTVVGIGAMGGGMARTLLESPVTTQVQSYDQATSLVDKFYEEAQVKGKAAALKPTKLAHAVTSDTDFVLIVLQNEPQCEAVCFGNDDDDNESPLLALMRPGSCVILSSTVTAAWTQRAAKLFATRNVLFVDSPISGGPVRGEVCEMTIFVLPGFFSVSHMLVEPYRHFFLVFQHFP